MGPPSVRSFEQTPSQRPLPSAERIGYQSSLPPAAYAERSSSQQDYTPQQLEQLRSKSPLTEDEARVLANQGKVIIFDTRQNTYHNVGKILPGGKTRTDTQFAKEHGIKESNLSLLLRGNRPSVNDFVRPEWTSPREAKNEKHPPLVFKDKNGKKIQQGEMNNQDFAEYLGVGLIQINNARARGGNLPHTEYGKLTNITEGAEKVVNQVRESSAARQLRNFAREHWKLEMDSTRNRTINQVLEEVNRQRTRGEVKKKEIDLDTLRRKSKWWEASKRNKTAYVSSDEENS
jgi:hypothetical protein